MECKNCKTPLEQEAKFCKECGGRVINEVISYRFLATEMSERFFNFENNLILRTIKQMTIGPEKVIRGYINGTRKKHLNVANYLALAITISGIQIFLLNKFFTENLDMSWMIDKNNPMAQNSNEGFFSSFSEYQSIMYVLFLPFYALIGKVVFYNKKIHSYLHHIIITAYTQAHLSIILFIPSMVALTFGVNYFKLTYFFLMPMMIVYSAYVYKRVFSLSMTQIVLKTLWFSFIGTILFVGFYILIFIILIAIGVIDLQDFAPKKEDIDTISYIASSTINWTS